MCVCIYIYIYASLSGPTKTVDIDAISRFLLPPFWLYLL